MGDIKDRLRDMAHPTGAEDAMAVSYPVPRLFIAPRQAVGWAVGICVVLGLVLAWHAAQPDAVPPAAGASDPKGALASTALDATVAGGTAAAADVAAGAETAGASGTTGAAGTAHPTTRAEAEPAEVVVSVVGHVASPGLLRLPAGSRVADALAQARPLPDADVLSLNQAQKLVDGTQIVLVPGGLNPVSGGGNPVSGGGNPVPGGGNPVDTGDKGGPPPHVSSVITGDGSTTSSHGGGSGGGAAGGLSLSTATQTELEALPGVGAKTAAAIIAYREQHGGFRDVAQLKEIKGIGPSKYAQIAPLVSP